jgi:hypothetical protein
MDSDAPAHDDDFQTTIVHFRMPEQATARDELGHYLVVKYVRHCRATPSHARLLPTSTPRFLAAQ